MYGGLFFVPCPLSIPEIEKPMQADFDAFAYLLRSDGGRHRGDGNGAGARQIGAGVSRAYDLAHSCLSISSACSSHPAEQGHRVERGTALASFSRRCTLGPNL